MPLKYLSNFWRSLEIPLIICKVELKLRSTKHCVLAPTGVKNDGVDSDNIIFTIKDTKLYAPAVTLSTNNNQKLSKHFSKEFERSVYWNKNNKKVRIKTPQTSIDIFLNQTLVRVNRLFV